MLIRYFPSGLEKKKREKKHIVTFPEEGKHAVAAEVSNLQPRLPGLAQGQEGERGGAQVAQVVFLFWSRKSPLFFRGTTPKVNYLQSGRPPVGVTICRSGTRLPELPLKGPPVVGESSLEVEEEGRKKKKINSCRPIHSDFQSGRLIVVDTPSSRADGRYGAPRPEGPPPPTPTPILPPPVHPHRPATAQLRSHICSLSHSAADSLRPRRHSLNQ